MSEKTNVTLNDNEKDSLRRIPTASGSEVDADVEQLRTTRTISRRMTHQEEDELSRILTGNSKKTGPLPPFGPPGTELPPIPNNPESYRVSFPSEDDPDIALNWSLKKKLVSCIALSFATLMVAWGSAVYGAAMPVIEKQFHLGITPAALGISLYVLGFAFGPIVWGPLCELLGRKVPLVVGMFVFLCFTFATATAKDTQTLMLSRFFSGAFGAATFSIIPAIFADMFSAGSRGTASAAFSLAVVGGPMIAPVAGAYIVNSYLSWRWTMYITGIGSAAAFVVMLFCYNETYQPLILSKRAAELRKRTGNWAIYAPHDNVELDISKIATQSLLRPIQMLGSEVILTLISLYNGFVYALLYMCLEALPIIFAGYEFKGGNIMLPYIAIFVGAAISCVIYTFVFEPMYNRALAKSGFPVVPEARLPHMMLSAVVYTISIFWLFWCGAYPKTPEHPNGVHWIAPTIALALFGFGFIGLFLPVINYIIDCYLFLAASAMAANTFLRSIMAAAFPLFTSQMIHNLGIQWAGTLIGCLAALMTPVPFLFYIYGAKLRSRSKYAFNLADSKPSE